VRGTTSELPSSREIDDARNRVNAVASEIEGLEISVKGGLLALEQECGTVRDLSVRQAVSQIESFNATIQGVADDWEDM